MAGDGWIVAAIVSWALYAPLQKKWPGPLSATALLAAICAGGVLVLLPFGLWEGSLVGSPAWSRQATVLMLGVALVTRTARAPKPSPVAAEVG